VSEVTSGFTFFADPNLIAGTEARAKSVKEKCPEIRRPGYRTLKEEGADDTQAPSFERGAPRSKSELS
jgi:hypothetical protein